MDIKEELLGQQQRYSIMAGENNIHGQFFIINIKISILSEQYRGRLRAKGLAEGVSM